MKNKILLIFSSLLLSSSLIFAQQIELDSIHIQGRNIEIYDDQFEGKQKALGGNIFIGTGFYQGNRADYFTTPFFIGINLEFHRKKWVFQFDDYIGFAKTRKDLNFEDATQWKQWKRAHDFMAAFNVGRKVVDTKNFMFVPVAGVGANFLTASFFGTSEFEENTPILPYFKVGAYVDFKSLTLLQKHVRVNDMDENYTSLRLSVGYQIPMGRPKYAEYFDGEMFTVTLGMGGLSRDFNRK